MLSCREVTELTSAYLDRELPLRKRLAMKMHLAMCRHCRRFVRQFRQLLALLNARARTPARPADPALVERILAELPLPHHSSRGTPSQD